MAGGLALTVLGGALFYARLAHGPIDLAFLTPRIEAAIDRELGQEIGLKIGGVVLERGGRTGLTVRLRDLTLLDREREPLAVIGRAEIGLDPVALLSGEIVPRRVDLLNPRLHVKRLHDGRLVITPEGAILPASAGPPEPGPVRAKAALALLDPAVLSGPARSFASAVEVMVSLAEGGRHRLESISIVDGEISYESEGERWRLPDVFAQLQRGRVGSGARLEVKAGGGEARYVLTLSAQRVADTGAKAVTLEVEQLPALRLKLDDSPASGLDKLVIPASGTIEMSLGPDGAILDARGRISVTAHQDEPGAPAVLREGDLAFDLDLPGRRLVLDPSPFALGKGNATLSGAFVWPEVHDFARLGIAFGLEAREVVLAANDVSEPPLPVNRLALSGAILPAESGVRIDLLTVQAGDVEISAQGALTLGETSPGVKIEVFATPMDVAVAKQLWPGFVAPGAREWVVKNVDAGRFGEGRFLADYPPDALHLAKTQGKRLAPEAMSLAFTVQDVTFRYFRDLPPVRGAKGMAKLDGNTFRLDASGGEVLLEGGEKLAVEGSFDVPMIHGVDLTGRAKLDVTGGGGALVSYLRTSDEFAVESADTLKKVGGSANVEIALEMVMKRNMTEEDVKYRVIAALENASLADLVEKQDFERASVKIDVAPGRFSVVAKGLLDGVPATIDLVSDVPPSRADLGVYNVSLLIDEKSGRRFGLDLATILSGPTLATIEGKRSLDAIERVSLDITNARLAPEGLGTLKAPGRKGEIRFRPDFGPSGKSLRDFEILAEDVAVRGSVTFAADGELQAADFGQFRIGQGDGATLSLKKQAGTLHATIKGKTFDLGPIIRGAAGGGGSGGALSVSVEVDRLIGLHGEEIRGASFQLASRAGAVTGFEGFGRIGSTGAAIEASVVERSGVRHLAVDAMDAGAVLRFLDLYERMQGGRLSLRARIPNRSEQPMPGILSMDSFRIVDDPGLQRLAAQTAGQEGRTLAQSGSAMPFDQLRAVFERVPGRTSISEGVIRGPAAGVSFQGVIDHRASELNLTGTFVPIYALNNIFSRIPIIGTILGGRSNEGLLGVTFALRGKTSNPQFLVNPLSAIAPGVFRRIFEFGQNTGQPVQQPALQ